MRQTATLPAPVPAVALTPLAALAAGCWSPPPRTAADFTTVDRAEFTPARLAVETEPAKPAAPSPAAAEAIPFPLVSPTLSDEPAWPLTPEGEPVGIQDLTEDQLAKIFGRC